MQIQQLRYFIEVARTGNISTAAKNLFISQPSLSQQIINLEKKLEIQLLIRHSKSVCLSDAGEQFPAVFPEAEEACVIVVSALHVFRYIRFFDSQHNMQKRPVDPGLCDLTGFEQLAELPVVEKVVQSCGDAGGQFF